MITKQLQTLGLTNNQIKIYEYILNHDPVKATELVNQFSMNRAVVYKTLNELIHKKLILKIVVNKVSTFTILEPTILEKNLEEQKIATIRAVKEIKSRLEKPAKQKLQILTFSGESGVIDFFDFVINQGKDWYIIGANYVMQKEKFREKIEYLQKMMLQKKFKTYVIADKSTKGLNWMPNTQVSYFKKNLGPSSVVIHIFGDYIAHTIWESPEFAYVFRNQQVAKDYKKYFKELQKTTK